MCGIAARDPARTFDGSLRRSTVAHFACKVRGGEYYGDQARAKNPTRSCPEALTMFATCSWPSLCEQSELQCWRRNRRLCGPVQISAARALPLTFDISILNAPSYASQLFVKTIITPAVPNKKSSIRGRKQHYLRPPVVLPPAASSTNGGRGSITSYRSCRDMVVSQAPPFLIPQKSGKSTLRPSD